MRNKITRRAFAALMIGGAGVGCGSAQAAWPRRSGYTGIDQRHLWMDLPDRRETLHVPFRGSAGHPDAAGMTALSWFSDHRSSRSRAGPESSDAPDARATVGLPLDASMMASSSDRLEQILNALRAYGCLCGGMQG